MGKIQENSGKKAENILRDILRKKGIPNFKLNTGMSGTVFDIIAVLNNKALSIEVKNVEKGDVYRINNQILKKKDEMDMYASKNALCIAIYFEEYNKFLIWDWCTARKLIFVDGGIYVWSKSGHAVLEVINAYFNR